MKTAGAVCKAAPAVFLFFDFLRKVRYNRNGAAGYGRRLALPGREVMLMVTYPDLIQIGILIVSICSLVFQICKRK